MGVAGIGQTFSWEWPGLSYCLCESKGLDKFFWLGVAGIGQTVGGSGWDRLEFWLGSGRDW